jgi:hypothetical protein
VAELQRECGLRGSIAGRGRSAIAPNVLRTAGSAADPACHGRSFLLQLSFSKTHRSQNFARSDWPRLFTL